MYVSPRFRGQGLGRQLLERAIDCAGRLEGIVQILLSVNPEQEAALGLYQKLGFKPFGLEPKALRAGDRFIDQLHMILEPAVG
jgi:ribosomal protein S18 acetylase RimI-like enzyme